MSSGAIGPRRIEDPVVFGRVAVLLGGASSEREISLMSGRAVHEALRRRGVDAHPVDPAEVPVASLVGRYDRVWIALHGPGGEDGTMQGALQLLGLPYTGSGVLGSSLCMDKYRSKLLLQAAGLPTAPFRLLDRPEQLAAAAAEFGFPLAVKPVAQGSSVGVHRVDTEDQLEASFTDAVAFDGRVLAEPWLTGEEYTAGVLGETVLPLIRIEAASDFYDYQSKYFSDATRYYCPCGLAAAEEQRLAEQSLQVFRLLGASGWGRVDFLRLADGTPSFLEVNTVPGMTSHSLVPMAARQVGIDFEELVWRILETSCEAGEHAA